MAGDLRKVQNQQEELKALFGSEYRDTDLVFTTQRGGPLNADRIRDDLRRVLKAAGLPAQFREHDLRHTNATILAALGTPIKVIQERLGQSTPNITLAYYSHVLPSMNRAATQTLEDHLFGAKTNKGGG